MRVARDGERVDDGVRRTRWLRMLGMVALATAAATTASTATAGVPDAADPVGPVLMPALETDAKVPMSAEQVAALADGVVDYDEYHQGARRHIACLAAAGYEVLMEEETFDLVNFGTPEDAVLSGVEEPCYEAEWEALDMQWQGDHIETSETAFLMARCLETYGIEVPATMVEKDAALTANGIRLEECR